MRTLLGHPEPPRGTVYASTSATLNATLVDGKLADLLPVNRTTTAVTRGWIRLDLNR